MLRSSFSVSNQMNCEMKCFVTFGFFLYAFVAVHGFKKFSGGLQIFNF